MRPAPALRAIVPWVVLAAALLVPSPGGADVAIAQPTLASGRHSHHGFRHHHFAPYAHPFSYPPYPYYAYPYSPYFYWYFPSPYPGSPRVWGYRFGPLATAPARRRRVWSA